MEYEINSILDTDLYKLTMMQAVYHQFPEATVEFEYKNRTTIDGMGFTEEMYYDFVDELDHLRELSLTLDERKYLEQNVPYLKADFLDFLESFRFNPRKYVDHFYDTGLEQIIIEIKGPWIQTILFEVPILAMVNAVFFKHYTAKIDKSNYELFAGGFALLNYPIDNIERDYPENYDFKFADFGTRRRFNQKWHNQVVTYLKLKNRLVGTSNVLLAMEHGLKPIGTMAHEWIQAGQGFVHPRDSQIHMLDKWVEEYQGELGTALSDTLGFDYFLSEFNHRLMKLYEGVRLDSGDPWDQADRLIDHYQLYDIDPMTKTVVFSDGLTIESAFELYLEYKDKINTAFGIGTSLTNNFREFDALQIVMKMTKCSGLDVAKISDTPSKTMCKNDIYIDYLKDLIAKELKY